MLVGPFNQRKTATENILSPIGRTYVQYTSPTPTRSAMCIHNSLVDDSFDESEQICQQRSRVASCRPSAL